MRERCRRRSRRVTALYPALTALCLLAAPPASARGEAVSSEIWRFRTGEPPSGAPAGGKEAVYVVTDRGRVFAVRHDGTELWRARAAKDPAADGPTEVFTAPPRLADGTLVFGSRRGMLYAFDVTRGTELWRYDVGGPVTAAPAFLPGEGKSDASVVVISQADGTVHHVGLASGQPLGTSPPTNRCDGPPAVGGGTIAYGNCDAALYMISAGSLEITRRIDLEADGQVFGGIVLDRGVAFAGDRLGRLYAADVASGSVLWVNEEARDDVSSTPAVAEDRVVYTADDGSVAALDRKTGRSVWRQTLDGRPKGPVLSADGRVIISADGTLHVLSLRDGSRVWSRIVSDEISSPLIVGDLVVVASDDGFLVAFGLPAAEEAP